MKNIQIQIHVFTLISLIVLIFMVIYFAYRFKKLEDKINSIRRVSHD